MGDGCQPLEDCTEADINGSAPSPSRGGGRDGGEWHAVKGAVSLKRCLLYYSVLVVAGSASAALADLRPVAITPGVYMIQGAAGEPSIENGARTGNIGFIVGPRGVVVIDTGVSKKHGDEIIAAVAKVTKQPIKLAIITQGNQEFIFGGAAFQARGIPVLAHERTVLLMRQRCETCLKNLNKLLGADEMAGSRVVIADWQIKESMEYAGIGRSIDILYHGWGSTPGDLVIHDKQSGVVFASGVSVKRIPETRDGSANEWPMALDKIATLPIKKLVPGHGAVSDKSAATVMRDYFTQTESRVKELVKTGVSLSEAARRAELPAYESWDQYALLHPQNVNRVYLRIEREMFDAK